MKLIRTLLAAALSSLLLQSTPALAGPTGPSVATKPGVGACLVDGAGMTLYTFKKDAPGVSACQGDCLAKWPVYFNDGGSPSGLEAASFGTITRADGARQTTYKGMPLYTFAADKAPGDSRGHGVKEVWFVAVP
jgi:predicted lipoprotein with Yx(FWY)xxD motif